MIEYCKPFDGHRPRDSVIHVQPVHTFTSLHPTDNMLVMEACAMHSLPELNTKTVHHGNLELEKTKTLFEDTVFGTDRINIFMVHAYVNMMPSKKLCDCSPPKPFLSLWLPKT